MNRSSLENIDNYNCKMDKTLQQKQDILEKSEKCWKSLLLSNADDKNYSFSSSASQNKDGNTFQAFTQENRNEWDLVNEYYNYQTFLKSSNNNARC